MRFLIKLLVFGFIGLAILPAFAPEQYRQSAAGTEDDQQTPSPVQLVTVVSQAAGDLANICTRQPGMCETGSELISFAATKAREGLDIAYAMFRHGHPSMQNAATETAEPESGIE